MQLSDKCLIDIVETELDLNRCYQFLVNEECGAVYLFVGTARKHEKDGMGTLIESLFYECYEEMCFKIMKDIVDDYLHQNHDIKRCVIVHRKGLVKVSQASIVIGASSPHRSASHQAVTFLLNEIKSKAPIWKKINFDQTSHPQQSQWSDKSESFWIK